MPIARAVRRRAALVGVAGGVLACRKTLKTVRCRVSEKTGGAFLPALSQVDLRLISG